MPISTIEMLMRGFGGRAGEMGQASVTEARDEDLALSAERMPKEGQTARPSGGERAAGSGERALRPRPRRTPPRVVRALMRNVVREGVRRHSCVE